MSWACNPIMSLKTRTSVLLCEEKNRYHDEVIAYNAVLVTCRALLCWSLALELLDVMVRNHSWMGKVGDGMGCFHKSCLVGK